MKKQIAMLWADALESNEYKQGKSRIRNGRNEFCCLGVLCNIHAQFHPEIALTQLESCWYLDNEKFLPAKVQKWAGMKYEDGVIKKSNNFLDNITLSRLNDNGYTFKQIANIIRVNYKDL